MPVHLLMVDDAEDPLARSTTDHLTYFGLTAHHVPTAAAARRASSSSG